MKRKRDGYNDSELPMLLQSVATLGMVVVICVGGFFGLVTFLISILVPVFHVWLLLPLSVPERRFFGRIKEYR